jgi:hypothetical protein
VEEAMNAFEPVLDAGAMALAVVAGWVTHLLWGRARALKRPLEEELLDRMGMGKGNGPHGRSTAGRSDRGWALIGVSCVTERSSEITRSLGRGAIHRWKETLEL